MLIEILQKLNIQVSSDSYNSALQPFFLKDSINSLIDLETNKRKANDLDTDNKLMCLLNDEYFNRLPDEIKNFYMIFNDIHKEIYINHWTFFGLQNTLDRYNSNYKNDNIYIIDLAFCYLGMGWINVLFFDPITDKLYLRQDGGSNGYDRELNYKDIVDFCKYYSINTKQFSKEFNNIIEFFEYINQDYENYN